jgi:hypothetical protein
MKRLETQIISKPIAERNQGKIDFWKGQITELRQLSVPAQGKCDRIVSCDVV